MLFFLFTSFPYTHFVRCEDYNLTCGCWCFDPKMHVPQQQQQSQQQPQ